MAGNPDVDPVVVERTGLVVLDKGDLVVPAEGSEALLSVLDGDGTLVLEFPVEVEIRVVHADDPDHLADTTLNRLLHALDGFA
ncbi:MAG: hypothetical protein ACJ74O_18200 [Frankiaceae bacterium]